MKRYAAAYEVKEHDQKTKVKVFWTRAEDLDIANYHLSYFLNEQLKQPLVKVHPIYLMEK